jgi:hypothetical protein
VTARNPKDIDMTDTNVPGMAGSDDDFVREYEAARAAQSGDIDDPPPAETAAPEREPLPPEEVEKRWRDTQAALRSERHARRTAERQAREAQEVYAEQLRALAGRDPVAGPHGAEERLGQADMRLDELGRAETTASLTREFQDYEAEFREVRPDYDDAASFLREARVGELVRFGHDAVSARQIFEGEVVDALQELRARGLDPAQAAYAMAQHRGYGAASSGGPLGAIARGQAAAKTLTGSGGGSAELTVEAVSRLEGAAFDAAFKRLADQERARERRR